MRDDLTLVFGAAVADRVQKLAAFYGEGTPEAIIARAIGIMEAIKPFVHEGVLTVIDPNRPGGDPADREVDLRFTNLVRPDATSVVA